VPILEQQRADKDRHAAEQHDPRGVGPTGMFTGKRFCSTVPSAHDSAAPSTSSEPSGAAPRLTNALAEQQREPAHAEREADELAPA
jgi:hypothetical protein